MTHQRSFAYKAVLATLLTSVMPLAGHAQEAPERSALHDFRLVTVADGLQVPWAMAFLPGGDMLVTERAGRLRIVRNGQLVTEPVPGLPPVRAGGQGGLMDVVPHPRFAENRLIYLTYSKASADGARNTTAVIRARFEQDRLSAVEQVIEANAWSDGEGHFGSRLAFDRQGYLFVTIGDRQVYPNGDLTTHPAQDLSTHHGKVLRLHDDGKVPADNPFVGRAGALPEIWSYGHRNEQGLVVDADTNEVWLTEHGPQGCGLAFEFLQAMELFKAGVHTATVSPTNAECRTPNAEGERARGTWIRGLMKLKGLPRRRRRRSRATMDACRT